MSSVNEIIRKIRKRADEIDNTRVYYIMRIMNISHIKVATVDCVKCCIAIQEHGFPITNELYSTIREITDNSANTTLHTLGDRKVLNLLRDRHRTNRWILSDVFKEYYYGPSPSREIDTQKTKLADKLDVIKHEGS